MLKIKTVTVIGANGTMGSLVAGIIASFGDAKVFLVSRNKQKSINVIEKIKKSVRSDAIEENLIPIDYSQLQEAVEQSDWIYESIIEDYKIKEELYKQMNSYNIKNAIISTGTSGLSINNLAEIFSEEDRKKFIGTHFFNPPYNLNLCEIITSKYTDNNVLKEVEEYLRNVLYRNTIIVKDTPAFLANRIGFEFLNELLQLSEEYKGHGGIDYIDSLFSGYTGRTMKPLETINFVGLDVHKAIVDNIYENVDDEYNEKFICPDFVGELINHGKLGLKTKEGLYRKAIVNDKEELQVYDIINKQYRKIAKYNNSTIDEIIKLINLAEYEKAYKILATDNSQEIQLVTKLLVNYIVYSLIISNLYAQNLNDCDDAMASGFNWCPPIALKEIFEKVVDIKELIKKYVKKEIIEHYKVFDLADKAKTKYDYRKYLKAIG